MDYKKLENTKFMRFVKFRDKFGLCLAIVVLVIYYVFVFAVGAFPEVLGYKLGPSSISLGLMIGAFIIITCVVLTGLYAFIANKFFDKELEASLDELRKQGILETKEN